MADLEDLITSKTRRKILELFYRDLSAMYHVRGVVREVKEEINAVRLELNRLHDRGVLKKEPRGNRVYFFVRKDYEFFEDLLSIVVKTTGLGSEIIKNRRKIGNVAFVMFSGRFARKLTRKKEDDVEVLVVGDIIMPEFASLVRYEEQTRQKEVNYTVMTRDEFDFRKKRRDPFLLGILASSRIMVIGDEEDLID